MFHGENVSQMQAAVHRNTTPLATILSGAPGAFASPRTNNRPHFRHRIRCVSPRPLRCTKRDLMRAIEGVQGRGLEVASVRVELDGTIHVVTGAPREAGPPETVSELVKKRMAELTDG
jgi:hypothetical protein